MNMAARQIFLGFLAGGWIAGIASCANAQSSRTGPFISNLAITDVSHASVHVTFNVNPPSYVQVHFGLTSGNYIYASASPKTGVASLSIGGLQPGTTYYFRAKARPNADNDDGICDSAACGSAEQKITTQPEPAVHPEPPQAPVEYTVNEVDTTGYTIVPMRVASDGQCVAAQNIARQNGWTGAVSAGDTIPAILNKIRYGTVLEFPQGAVCKVYETNPIFHSGYDLPAYPADTSLNHRWVVFRTKSNAVTDFPPFGFRTGPAWSGKMAKFEVQTPGQLINYTNNTTANNNTGGQVFNCYNANCHHFWFQNLEFTNSMAVYSGTQVDPPAFTNFITIEPNNSNPHHFVLDRLYLHSGPWPSRIYGVVSAGGSQFVMTGCYLYGDLWRLGRFPIEYPSASGNAITIPKAQWSFKATDAPIGMLAASTIHVSGSGTLTGWLDGITNVANGLTVRYNGLSAATCSNCTIASGTEAVPASAFKLFTAVVANGQATIVSQGYITYTNPAIDATSTLSAWKPLGLFISTGDQKTFDNNYIEAAGQTVYNDAVAGRTFNDQVFTRNHIRFPREKMQAAKQWNGYGYSFRNPFELKQCRRCRFEGNLLDGSAAYQNAGMAMMLVGSWPGGGTQDILVRNNTFRHVASGFHIAGGGTNAPPDAPTARKISITNNLFVDLDRDKYNNGGASFFSGLGIITPGAEDIAITKNTVDLTLGVGPALLLIGAAAEGTSVMSEGLAFNDNLVHLSLNKLDPVWSQCGQLVASHPARPEPICSTAASSSKERLDAVFVRTGVTVQPNYEFRRNVFIGGQTRRNLGAYRDMNQEELDQQARGLPAGNIFVQGSNLKLRRAAADWDANEFRASKKGNAGADIEAIQAASGLVQNIAVQAGPEQLQFRYKAPDERACAVETSPDGMNWTRNADTGGVRDRTVIVKLNPATSYRYRILCRYLQPAEWEYPASQWTSGTIATTR